VAPPPYNAQGCTTAATRACSMLGLAARRTCNVQCSNATVGICAPPRAPWPARLGNLWCVQLLITQRQGVPQCKALNEPNMLQELPTTLQKCTYFVAIAACLLLLLVVIQCRKGPHASAHCATQANQAHNTVQHNQSTINLLHYPAQSKAIIPVVQNRLRATH
jgi:hypothetical protein